MTPFPESEDMTIKRLYVALNRGDMQLLQMGAHKLHEKFHTGYEFKLIDNLKEILNHINSMINLPKDTKEVLVDTINNILKNQNTNTQFNSQNNAQFEQTVIQNQNTPIVQPTLVNSDRIAYATSPSNNSTQNIPQPNTMQNNGYQQRNENQNNDFTIRKVEIIKDNGTTENIQNNQPYQEENKTEFQQANAADFNSQNNSYDTNNIQNNQFEQQKENVQTNEIKEEQTYNMPENKAEEKPETVQAPEIQENRQVSYDENKTCLEHVAVFYDDKAPFIDFKKNKIYRNIINSISMGEEKDPMQILAEIKNIVDVPTDEINEIIKMLNMIKGDVYFATTSKSENVIKNFIENYVSFEIPMVTKQEFQGRTTSLIPLFGLSNIFSCPKCGEKEFFGGFHNEVLALRCKKCSSPTYPDIYEAEGLETNSHVYNWIFATKQLAKAKTWILINPPIESNKELVVEFLKQSFELARPKKVYIYSKETSKREYYKQLFQSSNPDCIIKGDFTRTDTLCEDFIKSEMTEH